MPAELSMPQMSDTMTEGTLVKWNKKEGDKVKAGEEIAEIETDKATMPMESFETGTLAFIAVKEGQKARVGDLLAVIATGADKPEDIRARYAAGGPAATGSPHGRTSKSAAQTAPNNQSYEGASSGELHEADGVGHQVAATRQGATAIADAPPAGRNNGDANGGGGSGGGGERLRISPLARRIASDRGVDLSALRGSGPGGRIVQKDVLAFLEQGGEAPASTAAKTEDAAAPAAAAPAKPAAPALAPAIGTGQTQVIPMTKMRVAIAAALQRSKQTIPHFYETIDIDVEELGKLRERLNARLEKEKVRLSIADFITRAVAASLVKHPALNARFNAEKNEVTRYGDVNMGIAVSIPDGLIVPVLRAAQTMGLREIRQRSADLIDRARAQRLRREEQTEGTFTISSLGTFGIREFSAIINPPEVGILAVGAAEKRPVVRGDAIVARTMMTVTLSCDHRVVDGAVAADFMRTLRDTLEEPGILLV